MKGKFLENISIKIRKNFMASRAKTFLMTAILVVAFLVLNLYIEKIDLPKFDITEKKVFTLSDASKNELKNVQDNVKVLVYGIPENNYIIDLLKQYKNFNDKIDYEIITDDNNPDIITKYGLQSGYSVIIVENGDKNKIISSYELSSYDYSTGQSIDLSENAITNAILNLTIAQKPKVYFLTGHNELSLSEYLSYLLAYLENEVFEYDALDLLKVTAVPDDCDLIAIMSPRTDLSEQEVTLLTDYINKGGNIIFTSDFLDLTKADLPNWQSILDMYGLTFENGVVYELDEKYYYITNDGKQEPRIFNPHIEDTTITSQIKSDSGLIIESAKRISTVDEETQKSLNVTYQNLLTTSENSIFLSDFTQKGVNELYSQTPTTSLISVKATKNLGTEEEEKKSEIIAIANGFFVSNIQSSIKADIAQVHLDDNANFFLNSVANLTNREDSITVRKDTNATTFTPTENERNIIMAIVFLTPTIIMIIGLGVWSYRRHKR